MSNLAFIAFITGFAVSAIAGLAIGQAFSSVLIRYRANYVPKTPELNVVDSPMDENVEKIGFFGMVKRVYDIEGLAGFYKGFMPELLAILFSGLFMSSLWWIYGTSLPSDITVTNGPGVSSILFSLVVGLPFQIISNRAIVTPYRLSIFGLSTSLRTLLTTFERRRPFVLYFAPGLALAAILQWAVQLGKTVAANRLATSSLVIFAQLEHLILEVVFSTAIVPLQVIAIKLSVQRNQGPVSKDSSPVDPADEAEGLGLEEYSYVSVNRIRSGPQYTGFIDCVVQVVREEGLGTLFRGWWINLLLECFVSIGLPSLLKYSTPPP